MHIVHCEHTISLHANLFVTLTNQYTHIFKRKLLRYFFRPRSILWGHWYLLFRTSDGSAYEFQSQGGMIVAYTVLLLVCSVPQSYLWYLGPSIEPRLLAPEVSTIPLHQPDPQYTKIYMILRTCTQVQCKEYTYCICAQYPLLIWEQVRAAYAANHVPIFKGLLLSEEGILIGAS